MRPVLVLLCVACLAAGTAPADDGGAMEASVPAELSPRPPASSLSPIQKWIDAAPAGAVVRVPRGTYRGDLFIDRTITIVGEGRPLLVGSGEGSVVHIRAANVVVEGLDIDGIGGGDLGQDASGIHIAAKRATIRDCHISRSLFGIYFREADGSAVEHCTIRGIPGKDPGEKGSGIHLWNTTGFRIERNEIVDVRDGFYIQSSSHGVITGNSARDLRYGIHYMFSDDNRFEGNTFANGAAGAALMYSRRIVFRRNRFVHNRGFASVGLLFKECDDVVAEENLIADNARGIFLEGSRRNVFLRNLVVESDTAIVLFDSCSETKFEGNSFVANLTPMTLVGKRSDTVFDGNYWSDNEEPDLDGDGRSDRPYRLSSVFDHFRGNLAAADLFSQGVASKAVGAAEDAFPVLDPISLTDRAPLVRPPELRGVPRPDRREAAKNRAALALSFAFLSLGASVLLAARRKSRGRA